MVHRECHNITMTEFVRQLGLGGYGIDDRLVVDATHLSGTYDFEFEYTPPRNAVGPGGGDRAGDTAAASDLAGPTIFDAVKQIGLRMEAGEQAIPAMVIDRAEQPLE